jgi:Na+-transporting NADH:ubiquinone oxidoreductase subunit A
MLWRMTLPIQMRGIELRIPGEPEQRIDGLKPVRRIGLVAADYPRLDPEFAVQPGDPVRRGDLLIRDRNNGVRFTSPGAGIVTAIRRAANGSFESLEIELNAREQRDAPEDADFAPFEQYTPRDLAFVTRKQVRAMIVESGLWTALRARPGGGVPHPEAEGAFIFAHAMPAYPLGPSSDVVLAGREADLNLGLLAVAKLSDAMLYYCRPIGARITPSMNTNQRIRDFAGPFPAGLPSAQYFIVDKDKGEEGLPAWHIDAQDVAAIGAFMRTGRLDVRRTVALGASGMRRPRLVQARLGASMEDLLRDELAEGVRTRLSGPPIAGRVVVNARQDYLGRYHYQVTALRETPAEQRAWFSAWNRLFWPYRRLSPTGLQMRRILRALAKANDERAVQLGAGWLFEEDVAPYTLLSAGKPDYARLLREMHDRHPERSIP